MSDQNIQYFDPPDTFQESKSSHVPLSNTASNGYQQSPVMKVSPWVLFILFLLAFVAFDFWADAGHKFVSQKFHSGGELSWQTAVLYASIITALFVIIILLTGVPVIKFEGF
ncbi:hypothetical protein OAG24_00130 [bacterium]|nr:hypothetical protein [bacterium]